MTRACTWVAAKLSGSRVEGKDEQWGNNQVQDGSEAGVDGACSVLGASGAAAPEAKKVVRGEAEAAAVSGEGGREGGGEAAPAPGAAAAGAQEEAGGKERIQGVAGSVLSSSAKAVVEEVVQRLWVEAATRARRPRYLTVDQVRL